MRLVFVRHRRFALVIIVVLGLPVAAYLAHSAIMSIQRSWSPPPRLNCSIPKNEDMRDGISVLEWALDCKLAESPNELSVLTSGLMNGSPREFVGYAKVGLGQLEYERIAKCGGWIPTSDPAYDGEKEHGWRGSRQFKSPSWWDAKSAMPQGTTYYKLYGYAGVAYLKWSNGYLYWFAQVDRWSPM